MDELQTKNKARWDAWVRRLEDYLVIPENWRDGPSVEELMRQAAAERYGGAEKPRTRTVRRVKSSVQERLP